MTVFIILLLIVLVILAGCHYFAARRVYQGLRFLDPKIRPCVFWIWAILFILIMAFSPLRSYWLGFFLYFMMILIVADLLILMGVLFKCIAKPVPERMRFVSVGICLVMALAVSGYGFFHAGDSKLVSYEIPMEGKTMESELNMVLISDIHLGAVGAAERIGQMVEKINQQNPDVVCIAGDIFDSNYHALKNPDEVSAQLREITAKYGVYACLGNHDRGRTSGDMIRFLERSNITLLAEESVIIDERFVLVGRLDASSIGGYGGLQRGDYADILRETDERQKGSIENLPVIVMDHNPANISEYGKETDLVLSGHTHKGQMFPAGLITDQLFAIDHGYGRPDSNGPHLVVTSGVGTWGMAMRVGTDSEIVRIRVV